jgi:hypothetical protein
MISGFDDRIPIMSKILSQTISSRSPSSNRRGHRKKKTKVNARACCGSVCVLSRVYMFSKLHRTELQNSRYIH